MTYLFTVRRAHLNDLKTLVAFTLAEADEAERKAKSANIVRAGVRAGLSDPAIARYWVVENAAGEVVGNISVVREWSDWHAGYYWWIQSLYIKPAFRGLGLMKLLVDRVNETAVSEQALELRLYVHEENQRALQAFIREGFSYAPYRMMTLRLPRLME